MYRESEGKEVVLVLKGSGVVVWVMYEGNSGRGKEVNREE